MGIDKFIDECWELCDEGWSFTFISDMWWGLTARCDKHGTYKVSSLGAMDVEESLSSLMDNIREGHKEC